MLAGGDSSTTLAAGTVLTRYACAAAALGSASSASTAANANATPRRLVAHASVPEGVAFDVLVKSSLRVVLTGVHIDDLARGAYEDRGWKTFDRGQAGEAGRGRPVAGITDRVLRLERSSVRG